MRPRPLSSLVSSPLTFLHSPSPQPSTGVGHVLKKKKNGKGGQRTTRGVVQAKRGPRSFAALLDEGDARSRPLGDPNLPHRGGGAPAAAAARKFCSVCGFESKYKRGAA